MDKAHVLGEAINYMKQLQERAKELEEYVQKKGVKSVINITRSHICIEDDTGVCEMNTNEDYGHNEALPDVEARVLGKDVLIKIHCMKQMGILVKILSQLEHLHLSISSTNVLPFGNTLDITIVAQMDGKYSLIVKDLVKNLRLVTVLK
ncbi:PREDICTED: transcription factor bHLH18-like [Lupinus angustifolius]|nr:PREDICTED: transcription factor bHLH18-like [Lupinus angustifolius]